MTVAERISKAMDALEAAKQAADFKLRLACQIRLVGIESDGVFNMAETDKESMILMDVLEPEPFEILDSAIVEALERLAGITPRNTKAHCALCKRDL